MPRNHDAHKYKRVYLVNKDKIKALMDKGKKPVQVWRCMLPGCSHYLTTETVIGKISECWKCGGFFEIERIHLERVKPTCSNCRGELRARREEITIQPEQEQRITDTLEKMLTDVNAGFDMDDLMKQMKELE